MGAKHAGIWVVINSQWVSNNHRWCRVSNAVVLLVFFLRHRQGWIFLSTVKSRQKVFSLLFQLEIMNATLLDSGRQNIQGGEWMCLGNNFLWQPAVTLLCAETKFCVGGSANTRSKHLQHTRLKKVVLNSIIISWLSNSVHGKSGVPLEEGFSSDKMNNSSEFLWEKKPKLNRFPTAVDLLWQCVAARKSASS